MDAAQQDQPTVMHGNYKMSWTAYIRPGLVFLVLFMIGAAVFHSSGLIGSIILLGAVGLLAFQVMTIRSFILYTDDHGVWVSHGILPWSKGVSGVKWRDMEDAVYFPNFFSWLLKSYTIRVGHRFTKTSEIVMLHIGHGHTAVVNINDLHRQMIAGNNV